MYHPFLALALALIFLDAALLVDAGFFVRVHSYVCHWAPVFNWTTFQVIQPFKGSTCHGGESCTISWIDDGSRPLLSAIGVSTVGLYTGEQVRRIDLFQAVVQILNPFMVTEIGTNDNPCGC